MQSIRDTKYQRHKILEIQNTRQIQISEMQNIRNTKYQTCKISEIQNIRDTKYQTNKKSQIIYKIEMFVGTKTEVK